MPSIMKMRTRGKSFFKKKDKTNAKSLDPDGRSGSSDDRSTPPMVAPIDPDGASTASHESGSEQIYLSNSTTNQTSASHPTSGEPTNSASDEYDDDDATDPDPADPMTASEFKAESDEEMQAKRGAEPQDSPAANSTNVRSRQGKDCATKSREGVPIITSSGSDYFSPSAVSSKVNYATDGFYSKSKKTFGGKERPKVRPSAKNSAFGGAPRYDWMDIETTAAIKIQAAYRRLQTQNRLDAMNLSTPGMRNRRAQRQSRYQSRMSRHVASADVPFPFSLCGVGLLFGDGTFEDERVVDSLEKKKVEKKKKVHEREDEEKRKFRMRKKESQHLEEGIEVVESFEAEEEEDGEEEEAAGGRGRKGRSPKSSGKGSGRRGLSMGSWGKSRSRSVGSPGRSVRPSLSPSRSKSKRLSREQNDFDGEDV